MSKRLILAAFVLASALLMGGVRAQAQTPVVAGAVPSGEDSASIRRQTFDLVWQTVKDKHFDPTMGGVDWDKVREVYLPRSAAASSDQELYRVLQEMLGELRQSHFNIIPPESINSSEDQKESLGGGIGVDLRLIGAEAMITRVEPGSSAANAGLRPGYLIKEVDGKPVEQVIAAFAKSAERPELKNIRLIRRVMAAINGDPGTSAKIVYLDDKNQRRESTLVRGTLKGELSPRFGNFPPQYTEFETKRLGNGPGYIGYIRFNIFTMPVVEKLKAAIAEFNGADGMIFDLRGNPGGVGGIASTIAGRICDKPGSLGTMKLRSGEMKFAIFPQSNPYTGPVAVLIDGMSASTSEVFSSGIQELGRAVIVGERSAGAALPSYFQKLPTGALFQFAIADFKTPKGVLIEGRGVSPDVEVKYDRASLLAGRDAQLEVAVEQIRKSQEKARRKQPAAK